MHHWDAAIGHANRPPPLEPGTDCRASKPTPQRALTHVAGLDGAGALITMADGQLTVRLTRDVWQLEQRHVQLARAVSAVARAQGAVVDRARAQEVQFAIAAQPDAVDVGFWRAALGYAGMADDNAVDPLGHGSTVWMQDLDPAKHRRRFQCPRELDSLRRAGNRVCICAWPDGASRPAAQGPDL